MGRFISFKEMDNREKSGIISGNRSFISLGLVVALLSLVGISGFNILQMLKSRRETIVYLMNGMDWSSLLLNQMARNAIIVLLPAAVTLVAMKIGISLTENNDMFLFGPLNLVVTCGLCAVFMLVSLITVILLYRDRSLSSLMRRDDK